MSYDADYDPRRMIGQGIMRTTYGLEKEEKNTYLIHLGDRMMKAFTEATQPGRFLVNILPALRHVPGWVPGTGWQKWFKVVAQGHQDILDTGFEMAKEDLVSLYVV